MDPERFKEMHDNLAKNITQIKETIKKDNLPDLPKNEKAMENLIYLYYSLTKSLIDIGHSIILENDFRNPLNRADVFISLAEQDILMPSVVPGIKKAVLALPMLRDHAYADVLTIITESIDDLYKCLDSFSVYFSLKDKKF
jgi:uncharacterized protein YutE (UPF0331/DUF86 family)